MSEIKTVELDQVISSPGNKARYISPETRKNILENFSEECILVCSDGFYILIEDAIGYLDIFPITNGVSSYDSKRPKSIPENWKKWGLIWLEDLTSTEDFLIAIAIRNDIEGSKNYKIVRFVKGCNLLEQFLEDEGLS